MFETGLLVLAISAFAYAMIAHRLADGIITPPMVFLGLGIVSVIWMPELSDYTENTLHILAEITLVIVLFSDAANVRARVLRSQLSWPGRMLIIGLPLAIFFGFIAGQFLLPDWPLFEIALIAAILAPTDAALGQAVITNPLVPERIRQALTVESGVNDGLALPAILLFGCLAVGGIHDNVQSSWVAFAAEQIGLGSIIGLVVGLLGGLAMRKAVDTGYTNDVFEGIGALALAAIAYLLSVKTGGNGFLSAFMAGLSFGIIMQERSKFVLEFIETEGQLLVLGTFLLLGISLTPTVMQHIEPTWIILILISLFVTRPLAIWISLLGTDTSPVVRGFMGWFGPRGLATALFALLVLQDFERLKHGHEILMICFATVLISAILHGVTAAPGARWLARKLQIQFNK